MSMTSLSSHGLTEVQAEGDSGRCPFSTRRARVVGSPSVGDVPQGGSHVTGPALWPMCGPLLHQPGQQLRVLRRDSCPGLVCGQCNKVSFYLVSLPSFSLVP